MISALFFTAFLTKADLPAAMPIPPPSSIVSDWVSLKKVPPEAAEFGLFSEANLSRLLAFKIGNPTPVRYGDISDPDFVPDYESPPGIAVYKKFNNWCLIHSCNSGWYWVLLRENELININNFPYNDPSNVIYKAFIFPNEAEGVESSSPDGWITYNYLTIVNPKENEQLRCRASMKSKSLGMVKGEYLRILDRKGDWIKVQEPIETEMVPAGDDKIDYLRAKWNPCRIGWIRWRFPGPIPGSSIKRLRGRQYFGIID